MVLAKIDQRERAMQKEIEALKRDGYTDKEIEALIELLTSIAELACEYD